MKKYLSRVHEISLLVLLLLASLTSYAVGLKLRYAIYIHPQDQFFRMTFEYPRNWEWHESRDNAILAGRRSIFTDNQEFLLVTPDLQTGQGRDLHNGWIDIDVIALESADKAKERVDEIIPYILDPSIREGVEVSFVDQILEIDGYYARRIIKKVDPSKVYGDAPFIYETVFILVDNSYYLITLDILESKRYGEFGQGFDHLVESIGFVSTPAYVDCQPSDLPLKEFQPEENSLLKLAFSYPGNWTWTRSPNVRKTYDAIYVLKPYMRILSVTAWMTSDPAKDMQDDIDLYLESMQKTGKRRLLSDTMIQIDGYDARWLTITGIRERENSDMLYMRNLIYLLATDRYYEISLYIPETQIDGCFQNEFKTMIEDLKVLP